MWNNKNVWRQCFMNIIFNVPLVLVIYRVSSEQIQLNISFILLSSKSWCIRIEISCVSYEVSPNAVNRRIWDASCGFIIYLGHKRVTCLYFVWKWYTFIKYLFILQLCVLIRNKCVRDQDMYPIEVSTIFAKSFTTNFTRKWFFVSMDYLMRF